MAMSRSQHEQPQVGKVAVGKEQTSKHTWPRRRDVSSLWYFSGWSFHPRAERVLQFSELQSTNKEVVGEVGGERSFYHLVSLVMGISGGWRKRAAIVVEIQESGGLLFSIEGRFLHKTNLQFWHILANDEKIDQMIPTDIYSDKNKYKKECK